MKGHIERTVTLSAGAILALALSLALSWGLDRLLPPDTWPTGALPLIFLMHGVTVIAAWLYRWASVLYIAPGLVIGGLLFGAGKREALPKSALARLVREGTPSGKKEMV